MTDEIIRHKVENKHPKDDSGKLLLKLSQWSQMGRFFK
jgi:hypothetical protein